MNSQVGQSIAKPNVSMVRDVEQLAVIPVCYLLGFTSAQPSLPCFAAVTLSLAT